ncbi:MAG: SIMPL domain-containing protein [Flavobacteriales bacterium]|nr:SIMPL domain-containing protein [Flavobacteriales bacterium]
MKKILTILLALTTLTSMGQAIGNSVYEKLKNAPFTTPELPGGKNHRSLNGRMLSIEANALMNVVPDAHIVVFAMVQLGATAQEATTLLDTKIAPIKAKLKALGIKNDEIVLDMVSFVPRYEDTLGKKRFSTTYTEIPKGFELKKNLHIRYKNHDLLDKIIAICAAHEVFDMADVKYVVLNSEKNKRELRDKMLAYLSDKIAFYHQLKVQDSIVINSINEELQEFYPMDHYHQYTAYSSSSYQAVKGKKRTRNISKVTKNTTVFYDPIIAKNFDIVINPGELKPTVQYTYKITVNYVLPIPPKVKDEDQVVEKIVEKKEYILITPQGETRVLKF